MIWRLEFENPKNGLRRWRMWGDQSRTLFSIAPYTLCTLLFFTFRRGRLISPERPSICSEIVAYGYW